MSYLLLTGATGLLGRFLLRDLLLSGCPVAVLVRPSRTQSASQRVDEVFRFWEASTGSALPRPVVLPGDLAEPGLGLSSARRAWACEHVRRVLHVAASITFHREAGTGEPYRSNVDGTRNLLAFCDQAGVDEMHFVSTAYVAGTRRGRVLEVDYRDDPRPGNDYEKSKLDAEQLVRTAAGLKSVTIHRPSIIVGDSVSAYTSTFHGFYTPLQLGALLSRAAAVEHGASFLQLLGLKGGEHKNLVPVDWVSAVIARIVQDPALHGAIYHLTNPRPVTVAELDAAIAEAIASARSVTVPTAEFSAASDESPRGRPRDEGQPHSTAECGPLNAGAAGPAFSLDGFRQGMATYRTYLRDDPVFDSSRTQAAVPDLPCPVVDQPMLVRLGRFAIAAGFGWPRSVSGPPRCDLARLVAPMLAPSLSPPAATRPTFAETNSGDESAGARASPVDVLQWDVRGSGGGEVHFLFEGERLVGAGEGRAGRARLLIYLQTGTLADLLDESLTIEDAARSARLVIAGESESLGNARERVAAVLEALRAGSAFHATPTRRVAERTPAACR